MTAMKKKGQRFVKENTFCSSVVKALWEDFSFSGFIGASYDFFFLSFQREKQLKLLFPPDGISLF